MSSGRGKEWASRSGLSCHRSSNEGLTWDRTEAEAESGQALSRKEKEERCEDKRGRQRFGFVTGLAPWSSNLAATFLGAVYFGDSAFWLPQEANLPASILNLLWATSVPATVNSGANAKNTLKLSTTFRPHSNRL